MKRYVRRTSENINIRNWLIKLEVKGRLKTARSRIYTVPHSRWGKKSVGEKQKKANTRLTGVQAALTLVAWHEPKLHYELVRSCRNKNGQAANGYERQSTAAAAAAERRDLRRILNDACRFTCSKCIQQRAADSAPMNMDSYCTRITWKNQHRFHTLGRVRK